MTVLHFPQKRNVPEQTQKGLWLLTFGGGGSEGYALVRATDADDAVDVWGKGWAPQPPDLAITDRTELSLDVPVLWAQLSSGGNAA